MHHRLLHSMSFFAINLRTNIQHSVTSSYIKCATRCRMYFVLTPSTSLLQQPLQMWQKITVYCYYIQIWHCLQCEILVDLGGIPRIATVLIQVHRKMERQKSLNVDGFRKYNLKVTQRKEQMSESIFLIYLQR